MSFTIRLDREIDGRWIAEVPELNVLLYGANCREAMDKADQATRDLIADRIDRERNGQ